MSGCPSEDDLRRLVAGSLPELDLPLVLEHIEVCPRCRSWLADTSDDPEHARLARLAASRDPHSEFPELLALIEELRKPISSRQEQMARPIPEAIWRTILGAPLRGGDLCEFDGYRVLSELGIGGMGVVFLGIDERLQRKVAIKVMRPDAATEAARARFDREVKAVAKVRHDNVIEIYGVFATEDGLPYCVFEYMEGASLADRIKSKGRLEPLEAAGIIAEVARGVAAAHSEGIVHRDVKPSNILFDGTTGRAKIADFGLARGEATEDETFRSQLETRTGTPAYMSPEQVRPDGEVGLAADVYGLGVTLYEAITGDVPFRGTVSAIHRQIVSDEPRPPRALNERVSRDLQTICLKCLEKDPRNRYPDASALADDLDRCLEGRPIVARPVSVPGRMWRWCSRNRLAAALLVLLGASAVVSVSLAVVAVIQERTVARQRDDVETAFAALRSSVDALLRPAPDELMKVEEARPYFEGRINEGLQLADRVLRAFGNDPRSRQIKAEALMMRAKLLSAKGDHELASASGLEAVALYNGLFVLNPDDVHHRLAMATLLHQLAALARDREVKRQAARKSNVLLGELLRTAKDRTGADDWLGLTILNSHNIGNSLLDDGRLSEAYAELGEAVRLCEGRASTSDRGNALVQQGHVEIVLSRVARSLAESMKDPAEAHRLREESFDRARASAVHLRAAMQARPDDFGRRFDLYRTLREIGQAHFDAGDSPAAAASILAAHRELREMEARFGRLVSRRMIFWRQFAELDFNLLNALGADPVKNDAVIREIVDEAIDACERLERAGEAQPHVLKQIFGYCSFTKADLRTQDGLEPDFPLLERAERLWTEALQEDEGNYFYRCYLFLTRLELAEAYATEGAAAKSRETEQRALAAASGRTDIMVQIACNYSLGSGIVRRMTSKLDADGKERLRDRLLRRGVWCIRQAVANGFCDRARLQSDPELTELRGDEEFRKMVADFGFPRNPFVGEPHRNE